MPLPQSIRPDLGRLGQEIAARSERTDADLERFEANWRGAARRFGLCSVLGAVLVVGFGVWGFRYETNSSTLPVRRHAPPSSVPATRLPASAVMVTIDPRAGPTGVRRGE